MRNIVQNILEIVYPPHCCVCKGPSRESICASCEKTLPLLSPPYCRKCGTPEHLDGLCSRCQTESPSFDRVRSSCAYSGSMKKAIASFKFHGKRRLAQALAPLMLQLFEREFALDTIDFIIPVPLHAKRESRRGFNQSTLLGEHLSEARHIPLKPELLERIRDTATMNKLGWPERRENMKGAFRIKDAESVKAAHILLIDDIITTGATLNEIAHLLKMNGASRVQGITLARTLQKKQQEEN